MGPNPDRRALWWENRKLTKQVAQLEKRLKQLETLIEVQKKLSELLEFQAASPARGQDH